MKPKPANILAVLILTSIVLSLTGCGGNTATMESVAADPTQTPTITPTHKPYYTPTPTPTLAPTVPPPPTPTIEGFGRFAPKAVVVAEVLNARSGPGMRYPLTGDVLRRGDEVELTGYDPAGGWLRFEQEGREGWITGDDAYVLVVGRLEVLPAVEVPALPAGEPPEATPAPESTLGGKVVFTAQSGGEIYVINADGSGLRHLTHGLDPALSPDGKRVAFTRWEHSEAGVWVIDVDGSGERNLVQVYLARSPAWSSDGTVIVFNRQAGGHPEDYVKCVDFDQVRDYKRIIGVEKVDIDDGEICLELFRDPHWRLGRYIIDREYFEDLPSDNYSYAPTCHPTDPNLVYYTGGGGLNAGIIGMDMSNMTTWWQGRDVNDHTPVLSPDGTRFASSYDQHGHWEIHTFIPDGGDRKRLTESPIRVDPPQNSASPTWSPDGKHIAFVTDRRDKWEIWVMNADGTEQRPMFPDGTLDGIEMLYAGADERMLSWGQ